MTTRDDLVSELRQQARNRTEGFGTGAHVVTLEWQAANRITDLERQLAEDRERCARIAETLLEHTDGNIAHAAEAIAAAIRGGAK